MRISLYMNMCPFRDLQKTSKKKKLLVVDQAANLSPWCGEWVLSLPALCKNDVWFLTIWSQVQLGVHERGTLQHILNLSMLNLQQHIRAPCGKLQVLNPNLDVFPAACWGGNSSSHVAAPTIWSGCQGEGRSDRAGLPVVLDLDHTRQDVASDLCHGVQNLSRRISVCQRLRW